MLYSVNRQQDRQNGVASSISVRRNERLTAWTGAVLFVLIVAELVVTANLHSLISVHIFIGVLLAGPLVVKMASTGYRFLRYYNRNVEFVQAGPPHILLRLLAPLLVFFTILVFVSGFGLAVVGPHHLGLLFKIHAASVALWLPLAAVHIYAHIRKVPGLIRVDLSSQMPDKVRGRNGRIGVNLFALFVGLIAAILMLPVSQPWNDWRIHHGVPSPLAVGLMLAVFAIFIAMPLLRTMRGSNRR